MQALSMVVHVLCLTLLLTPFVTPATLNGVLGSSCRCKNTTAYNYIEKATSQELSLIGTHYRPH